MRYVSLLALLLASLIQAGCSGDESRGDIATRKIRVVTTTGMVTDLVQNIGGDRVEVTGLMGPGVDPHLYRASEGDTARMARADLIVYNGLHLEGKMTDVFERMQKRVKTVPVTDGLDPKDMRPAPPGFEGTHDPHIWFDVSLWKKAAEQVRKVLSEMDPASAESYKKNAGGYIAELDKLDAYVRSQVQKVPTGQRILVTAHDAFYYFGNAYGFEVQGLQGISTESESSPADIQKLARFIAERRLPAIFVESSVPTKTLEAVQAAVTAKGHSVRIGGELYSDALGDRDGDAGTYVGMIKHNVDTIVSALTR